MSEGVNNHRGPSPQTGPELAMRTTTALRGGSSRRKNPGVSIERLKQERDHQFGGIHEGQLDLPATAIEFEDLASAKQWCDTFSCALDEAVLLDRDEGVLRAGRVKPAMHPL